MISDPVPFLANVAQIAYADGKLTSSELGQLETIRLDFKLKKSDYNKAISLVEEGNYFINPIGSFAEKVLNLEAILRIAYSDDELSPEESKLISKFCGQIGLSQEQLNTIAHEVIRSLKPQNPICRKCGQESKPGAQFCSSCGQELDASKTEDVAVEFNIPASGVCIEFADSTAASFHTALQLASETSSYETCRRGKKTWHLAVYPSGAYFDALPLAQALSGLRNKKLHVDGLQKEWSEIFGFAWCAQQREKAYRPLEYCFGKDCNRLNPWGCRNSRLDWTEWAEWFCYGEWVRSKSSPYEIIWKFDKERIRHELATALFQYRHCPFLLPTLGDAFIRLMPDYVDPSKDNDWGYSRSYDESPGSIEVTETERDGSYSWTSTYWSNGVKPKGYRLLGEILTQAVNESGYHGLNPMALLE